MALEINEIGIRMQVRDGAEPAKGASDGGGCRDLDREQIVEYVVLRVLKILKLQKER